VDVKAFALFHPEKVRLSNNVKVVMLVAEYAYPFLLFLYLAFTHQPFAFLQSPVASVYFVFITLSVLHLDFRLSLIGGAVAALQYGFITWYSFHIASQLPGMDGGLDENSYYMRATIFFVTGSAAAFVAHELRRRIKSVVVARQSLAYTEGLFQQQVSGAIAHELMKGGAPSVQEATVLALDIRDFSSMASQSTCDDVLAYQNKVFAPVLDIIHEYGGVVNQITGDGMMATFGIRHTQGHAQSAYRAAVAVYVKVRELVCSGAIGETRIGMGLHTGAVPLGNIGSEQRKQFSVSGATVILAFRVERLNKQLHSCLLMTQRVRECIVEDSEHLRYAGEYRLKGFMQPMPIYEAQNCH